MATVTGPTPPGTGVDGPGHLLGGLEVHVADGFHLLPALLVRDQLGEIRDRHGPDAVAGLTRAFGSGAMTNSIADLEQADVIFVIGSNTTECHPIIGAAIKRAIRFGETRLIVADPRTIELAELADLHLQQRNGTDVASAIK